MVETPLGTRDARGNWRPPYIIEKPIFMSWPLKPVAVLKFFFGWPGYLWPWNALFFAFPLVAWLYMTPPLAEMKTFEAWWVAIVFARNLGFTVLLFGAWYLWFYVFKAQGTHTKYTLRPFARKNKVFAFNNQLADNIFWCLASGVPIWTAYEVVTLWAFANGYVPFVELRTDPVWFVVFMLLIPLIREFHFYAVHRLLHWRPLYELAHKVHHRNVNVGPWAGMSMHPVEHVLYFSGALLHWVIPSHPLHMMFHLHHAALSAPQGHHGFESFGLEGKAVSFGGYGHYLHHRYFECNYGGGDGLLIWDVLFGTWHDGSDEAHERMKRRLAKRHWAEKAAGAA